MVAATITPLIEQEPRESIGIGANGGAYWGFVAPQNGFPLWTSYYACDIGLRSLYRSLYNTLVQGAIAGKNMRIRATPWQLKGGRNLTYSYQEMLQNAHFGKGWAYLLDKTLIDYHTQNKGAFWLLHGGGNPDRALTGRVTSLYHLDAGLCYLTGNEEYPVVYQSRRTGKLHRLHKTRVIHFVDSPDPDEWAFDFGQCALYRFAGVAGVQIDIGKYQAEKLSNLPPTGILTIQGISDNQFRLAQTAYESAQTVAGQSIFKNLFRLHAIDPNNPLKVESIPFSQLPDHFNYAEYMDIHVNLLALSLGVDRQDIFPLQGSMAGTATQSRVLGERAAAKGYADCLSMIERALNIHVLPDTLEFQFKFADQQADKEQADKAKVWVEIANAIPGLAPEQRLQLLANQSEALADVILDPEGQVKLPDADVKPNADAPDVQQDDTTTPGTQEETTANDEQQKSIQSTRLSFEDTFADVLTNARSGDLTKARFRTITRGLVQRYGRMAYEDGLQAGGVDEAPDPDDLAEIAALTAAQTEFIAALSDVVYSKTGLTDGQAEQKPSMWYNKSISPFYDAGLLSANRNGYYLFTGTDGAKSCGTCQRLQGQVHRLKDWTRKRLRPRVDTNNYICGGWQCKHLLSPADGRASGRF